ncbi:MAG: acetolactate synthase large subunit [Nitrospirae bacterium]|nr:acetolactate synthase large subunit [Nitrospirota bacterium]MCL5238504.1 acetolactate synthase large subunit [Nitrospirota bacterium]
MNGAELLIKCLENEGVRYAFGLPGEENLEVLNALGPSGIETIITRDERGAAFMANAWGRLTGSPGVCFSTLGPGATNLVTGVADAFLDFAPMLAITAQISSLRRHKESHQYIDVLSMLKPITKWNAKIESPGTIPEVVRKTFKVAVLEKMGPTHIEIPEDITEAEAAGTPITPVKTVYPVPAEEQLKKGVEHIKESKMPVILAGNGVIRSRASSELLEFARKSGIAVINTFMGMGVVPADDELFVSTIGLQSMDYVLCGINKADLIIAVGYDPVEFSTKYWDADKKIIHINTNPAEVDVSYNALELTGDIKTTLRWLAERIGFQKDPSYFVSLKKEIEEDKKDRFYSSADGISPLKIVLDMRAALGREDILISDVGAHKIWIARFYPAYAPNTVLISNGFSSMGFAVPAAISAKLLHPDKKIIAAVGDGGFMMSVAEMETAVRLKVPFVTVIFNDNCYGLIQWKQMVRYKRDFCVRVENPDFIKLGEAFGCKTYRAEKGDDLPGMLRDALGQKAPSIIDCRVDYSLNMKLTEKLGHIVCKI